MDAQNSFIAAVKAELDERASSNDELRNAFSKEKKTWEECENYLMNQVHKIKSEQTSQSSVILRDEVIFNMAINYWLDDSIVVSKPISKPVVKTSTPTTTAKKPEPPKPKEPSLFDEVEEEKVDPVAEKEEEPETADESEETDENSMEDIDALIKPETPVVAMPVPNK